MIPRLAHDNPHWGYRRITGELARVGRKIGASTAWPILQRGDGTVYTFTQVQAAGMPDDVFDRQVAALSHELAVLKALLEVTCPL